MAKSRDPAKPARSRARAAKSETENSINMKPAGAVQADTPVEEANRRTEAGQPAPNAKDVERAKNAVEAQGTADTTMLMGPNSDSPQEQPSAAPTEQEFRAARAGTIDPAAVAGVTGRSIHDVQAEQNAQVAMLTSSNPPKHIVEQRQEAAQRIADHPSVNLQGRRGRLPVEGRALSLHEMGQAKAYGTRSAA
jgi:hypothetical protein